MEIIDQSHEIIDRNMDTLRLIELCGRTCYKSEDKITDDSAAKFVEMLVKRGHWAMVEHATACFDIHHGTAIHLNCANNKFIELSSDHSGEAYIASANLTAWAQYFEIHSFSGRDTVSGIYRILQSMFPIVFPERKINHVLADYFEARPLNDANLLYYSEYKHIYRTVKFITNRGVTHELVRHRPPSFAQESTRYVNYGGNIMQFIKPVWWNENRYPIAIITPPTNLMFSQEDLNTPEFIFMRSCANSATAYKELLHFGWRPEQAREILPNALKTEIVVTANLIEWKHIFKLRCAKTAHPQIRELMIPVRNKFAVEFPEYF